MINNPKREEEEGKPSEHIFPKFTNSHTKIHKNIQKKKKICCTMASLHKFDVRFLHTWIHHLVSRIPQRSLRRNQYLGTFGNLTFYYTHEQNLQV